MWCPLSADAMFCVKCGTKVISNDTLEEIAEECNTINYEILSTISNRVPRVFID